MKIPTALAMLPGSSVLVRLGPQEPTPPALLGEGRHVWDEATYETFAWCGPALGSTVLR